MRIRKGIITNFDFTLLCLTDLSLTNGNRRRTSDTPRMGTVYRHVQVTNVVVVVERASNDDISVLCKSIEETSPYASRYSLVLVD